MNSRLVLLLFITTFAGLVALFKLSTWEFWWQYPVEHAWLVVILYWGALAILVVGGFAAVRLAFGSSESITGAWRLVGAGAILVAGSLAFKLLGADIRSAASFYGRVASGELPPADIRYNAETERIVIQDALRLGSAARFRDVLRAAPKARVVEVGGPGGLIGEARWISKQIEERGMDTLITGRCMSACVDIFASGVKRTMHAKAVVGLHSASSSADDAAGVAEENRLFTERLYRIGVEPRFLMVGTETPADGIWINSARQALIAGLATAVVE